MDAIKQLCKRHGITQVALSRRFGIPYRTIQNWYEGQRKPPAYLVVMMDELLEKDKERRG